MVAEVELTSLPKCPEVGMTDARELVVYFCPRIGIDELDDITTVLVG